MKWLLILGFGFIPALGAKSIRVVEDSTAKSDMDSTARDSTSAGARIYEYIAYPTLQLVTWPVEKLLVPVVRTLTYPMQEPMRYFLNENVIDRTRNLVGFGKNDRILIYPTLSLAPGTGSRIGLTLRNQALFGNEQERLVANFIYYVNGDYKARSYVTAKKILETHLTGKVSVGLVRMKNSSSNQPGTNSFFYYADTSETYQFQLTHPLLLGFSVLGDFSMRLNRLSPLVSPPPCASCTNIPTGDFFKNASGAPDATYRGIGQSFLDRSWAVGLGRDTRNNENITLTGSRLDVGWRYHNVEGNHDYGEWGGQYTKYFKLGRERYEITAAEEKRRGNMSMEKFIQKLEYEKLRNEIFSRKVVALHVFTAQSYEVPGNSMPINGLQALGNDSPLRGYAGARFRDYTVASVSAEYRFPVLRLMDGTLFDEYGVRGRSWDKIDYLNYKNSWGFGIRVRRPDLYLFRMDVGIHGLSGAVFNMSVDAPF